MGFVTVALLIWTTLHAYVIWRMASLPVFSTAGPRVAMMAVVILLAAAFFLGEILGAMGHDGTARPILALGVTWMGVVFYVFVCLLILDIVTGFGFLFHRHVIALRSAALLVAGGFSVLALVLGHMAPVVTHYDVSLPGLPAERDGTVLVFMSDLHMGSDISPDWTTARVAEVQALKPDLIVVGGDVFEHIRGADDPHVVEMRRLAAPLGVWAVTGNHDLMFRSDRTGPDLFAAAGFRTLHDAWQEAAPGLIIAGINDRSFGSPSSKNGGVSHALANRPQAAGTVFISHAPVGAEVAAKAGAGLMLSGHTHEGQIWPFGYLVRIVFPLLAGRYDVDGMAVIVSRGTGTWGPRMRLWHRGEILRVVLRAAPQRAAVPASN
jgi:predicted MPP superfamily phosphohydrolase